MPIKWFVTLLWLVSLAAPAFAESSLERFSNNPIGKLNFVGVALAEDPAAAQDTLENYYRGAMKLKIPYECLIDPTYRQQQAQKAFDISFLGKSLSGKKFSSAADTALELNANVGTMLIIDRQKRVRAFSQVLTMDLDQWGRVAEELLLNLDGKETITVDSEEEGKALGWQTDLGKERAQKKSSRFTLDFGLGKKSWYRYLGEPIPDVKLQTREGRETTLHQAIDGKVSLVFLFMASADPNTRAVTGGISSLFVIADELYRAFTLGEAKPGKKQVPNAQP
jgi:hypothetical protein